MARPNRFRDLLQARGITTLMHFTPVVNLPSIIEHGLQPAATLDTHGLPYVYTDSLRLDGFRDAISLSITCCNWAMLWRLKQHAPGVDWVLLGLGAELMVGADCRFYQHNAATRGYARGWKQYRSLQDFENMFADVSPAPRYRGASYRGDHCIPDHLTTDPQAEVLHFGGISAEWIDFVIVESPEMAEWAAPHIKAIPGVERPIHVHEFVPCFGTPFAYYWGMASPTDPVVWPGRFLASSETEATKPDQTPPDIHSA